MKLIIKQSTAVKLFETLGFKTAGTWDLAKLQKKTTQLPELTDGVKINKKPKMKTLLKKILEAKKVEISPTIPEESEPSTKEPSTKKNTESSKKSKNNKKTSDKKKEPKTKRPGVITTILDVVKKHGPISKEQIVEKLLKIFPDRPEKGMKSTVGIQVPSRLNKEKKANIKKDDKGKYHI